MTVITAKWTLEQYHQMIEAGILDDCAVELLRGEIVQMSPEGTPHASQRISTQDYLGQLLGDALSEPLRERAQVRPAAPITLLDGSEPEPDLAIVHQRTDYYRSHHPYPENIFWVIEYSNTSLEKDLGIKAEIYAKAGIQEYWVVNLKENKLMVFRDPIKGRYQSRQEFTQGTIRPIAFPDVVIPISRLLQ
jgi:Uma2 family endonuclease